MKTFYQNIFFIQLQNLICLLLIFFSLSSCTNEKKDVEKAIQQEFSKTEFGENVEILLTKKGKANIKIIAPTAVRNYSKKSYSEFPDGMKLIVFNESGEVESTLNAKYGKMGDKSTDLIAKDSVVVTNKTGETLQTEHLIWDKKKSKIRTEGFVKIQTEDEIIYGDGFESNDDFTEYEITNIKGIVKVKGSEF